METKPGHIISVLITGGLAEVVLYECFFSLLLLLYLPGGIVIGMFVCSLVSSLVLLLVH